MIHLAEVQPVRQCEFSAFNHKLNLGPLICPVEEEGVKNGFQSTKSKRVEISQEKTWNRCQVKSLREGCHERKKLGGVSSREKKNHDKLSERKT